MNPSPKTTILRIELWHVLLLCLLALFFGQSKLIDARALILGGIFMGVNFLLLSYGIAWILTPLANKGRVKAGVALLVIKIALFLGLLMTLFYKFELDAVSFAVGFSTLIVAILIEAIRRSLSMNKVEA